MNNFDFSNVFTMTFSKSWNEADIFKFSSIVNDLTGVPTTFDVDAAELASIERITKRGYKNLLPFKKIILTLSANSIEGKEYLKKGWPVLLPGFGKKWFFVGDNNTIVITCPLNKSAKDFTIALPLNQFDRNFSNEELLELNKGNMEKNIQKIKEACIPF